MEIKEMVCIVCPLGCNIKVMKYETKASGYIVYGNKCPRGEEYGIRELTNPTRVLTTTVKIKNSHLTRLPVRTKGAIPKDLIFEIMNVINDVEVVGPINKGEVIIKDVLGTGMDVIASRSL